MWGPRVAWATSNRYSTSCHTLWRISWSVLHSPLWSVSWTSVVLSAAGRRRHCPSQKKNTNRMASEIAWSNTGVFVFVGFCEGQCLRLPAADNTTLAQDTDQRGLYKHWSGNCTQRVAGGWISVWCCSSHSWPSHWTLLTTNYCS
jgi:hypothetical protein